MFADNVVYTDHSNGSDMDERVPEPKTKTTQKYDEFLIYSPHVKVNWVEPKPKPKPKRKPKPRPKCKTKPKHDFLIHAKMNGKMLLSGNFNNCKVTIVGQVEETLKCGTKTRFTTSDTKSIIVVHAKNVQYNTKFVEIKGYHTQNGLIHETYCDDTYYDDTYYDDTFDDRDRNRNRRRDRDRSRDRNDDTCDDRDRRRNRNRGDDTDRDRSRNRGDDRDRNRDRSDDRDRDRSRDRGDDRYRSDDRDRDRNRDRGDDRDRNSHKNRDQFKLT